MNDEISAHPGGETLELYALNRLPELRAERVDEHLLWCRRCQDAMTRADDFVRLMKAAMTPEPVVRAQPQLWGIRFPVLNLVPRPWISGLAAALTLVIVGMGLLREDRVLSPTPVLLSSFRGFEAVTMAHGPALAPLEIGIDTRYLEDRLPKPEECRIEIVDSRGDPAWDGGVRKVEGRLLAQVSDRLDAGTYWVRLYGANAELVQEFGLELE